jgi:hypothetical protein
VSLTGVGTLAFCYDKMNDYGFILGFIKLQSQQQFI